MKKKEKKRFWKEARHSLKQPEGLNSSHWMDKYKCHSDIWNDWLQLRAWVRQLHVHCRKILSFLKKYFHVAPVYLLWTQDQRGRHSVWHWCNATAPSPAAWSYSDAVEIWAGAMTPLVACGSLVSLHDKCSMLVCSSSLCAETPVRSTPPAEPDTGW